MHSDDERDLKKGEPIITLVLMEDEQSTRTFRITPKGEGVQNNYELGHGDVLIILKVHISMVYLCAKKILLKESQ